MKNFVNRNAIKSWCWEFFILHGFENLISFVRFLQALSFTIVLFLFHFCSFWTIFHTLLQTYFPRNIFQNLNNPKNVHAQKLNKQKYYIVQASNKGRWLPIVKFGWLFCSHNSRFFFLLVQLLNSLTRLSESYDTFCSLSAGPKCFFNRDLSHHLHGADQIFGIQRRDFFSTFLTACTTYLLIF